MTHLLARGDESDGWARRFHAGVLESVTEAIIATDLDGVIVSWNRAVVELYGWKRAAVLGRSLLDEGGRCRFPAQGAYRSLPITGLQPAGSLSARSGPSRCPARGGAPRCCSCGAVPRWSSPSPPQVS
jgi:PAS domain-containing protein